MQILERWRSRQNRSQPEARTESSFSFSPRFTSAAEAQTRVDQRFQTVALGVEALPPVINSGNDHEVHKVNIGGEPYVFKRLKPTSREYSVLGKGISPSDVPLNGTGTSIASRQSEEVGHELLASLLAKMQTIHNMALAYLGEEHFIPTGLVNTGDSIFRVQPYIHLHNHPEDELKLRALRMHVFYEELRNRWRAMQHTADFANLPSDVQAYCRFFPPDDGKGSNAIFMGLWSNPEFKLIDY